jgi:tape measure domain-containing protein
VPENVLELGIDVLTSKAEADLRAFARKTEAEMKKMAGSVAQANIGAATSIGGPMSRVAMYMNSAGKQQEAFNERWGNTLRLGQQVGAGMTAAGVGIMAVATASVKAAMNMEQIQVSFTTLLKSAEKSNKFIKELQAFAAQTPFEFGDLQEQAKQLLAFGFSAKDILPMLTNIGDAVGALGGGGEAIGRLGRALGQMKAKGKPAMEELLQLGEAGVPVFAILEKQLGLTGKQVADIAKSGIPAQKVIDALLKGMAELYGGGMEKQSKTVAGMMSNFKDQLEQLLVVVGTALLPVLKTLSPMITAVANGFAAVANSPLGPPLTYAAVALGAIMLAVGPLLMALPGLLILFTQLAALLAGLGAGGGVLASIGAAFGSIGATIGWITTVALPAVLGAAEVIGGIIAGILASPAALVAAIVAVIAAIGLGIYALVNNWDAVKAWFAGLPKLVGETAAAIGNGIAYAIGWVFGWFTSLPLRLADAYKAVKTWVVDTYKTMLAWIKNLPHAMAEGFKSAYAAVAEALGNMWTAVKDFFANLWSSLLALPGRLVDAVVEVFKGLWKSFRTGFKPGAYFGAGMTAGSGGKMRAPVPGRAKGGPVKADELYVVGERGPEYFVPKQSGAVFAPEQIQYSPFGAGYTAPHDRYENSIFGGLREVRPLVAAAATAIRTIVPALAAAAPLVLQGSFPKGAEMYERTKVTVNVNVEGNIYGDKQFERVVDERITTAVMKAVRAN